MVLADGFECLGGLLIVRYLRAWRAASLEPGPHIAGLIEDPESCAPRQSLEGR